MTDVQSLTEDPFIEVFLSHPAISVDAGITNRVLIQFGEVEAAGPHGTAAALNFIFEPAADSFSLHVIQPGHGPRNTSPGEYQFTLPWNMLAPLLAAAQTARLTATLTRTGASFFGAT